MFFKAAGPWPEGLWQRCSLVLHAGRGDGQASLSTTMSEVFTGTCAQPSTAHVVMGA